MRESRLRPDIRKAHREATVTLQHRTLFQTKAVIATLGGALWLGVGLARLPSGDPKARVLVGFGLLCLALGGGLFLWVRRQ